jgi:chromosome segregation ATPase
MPTEKTLSQRYEELRQLLHELTESLARIDERVEFYMEKMNRLEKEFDLYRSTSLDKIQDCAQKVTALISANGDMTPTQIMNAIHDLMLRLRALEVGFEDFPHAEVVRELHSLRNEIGQVQRTLEDYTSLVKKVDSMEAAKDSNENRWKTVGWFAVNFLLYVVSVVGTAMILKYFNLPKPS